MAYTPITYVDVPPGTTPPGGAQPLSAGNENHTQAGIVTVDTNANTALATAGAISALLGQPGGYASLDSSGHVPSTQLPTGAGASLFTPIGTLLR